MTPWTIVHHASLSITNSQSLLRFMSIESVMPFYYLLLSFHSPPVFNLSQHQDLFKWVGFSHQMAKVLELQVQSFHEYSGLISFRIDCFDLHADKVSQESSSTPQFKSINSLVLSFLLVQLLNPYMTTGKTIALTRRTFVVKVLSLLFNMLFRLVTAFLPRSKNLLISWLQSPSAVILEPQK